MTVVIATLMVFRNVSEVLEVISILTGAVDVANLMFTDDLLFLYMKHANDLIFNILVKRSSSERVYLHSTDHR